MKKENKFKTFLQKKGFYIGLYAFAAIIVALAGVISLNNINSINQSQPAPNHIAKSGLEDSVSVQGLEPVDQSDMESYVEKQLSLEDARKDAENNAKEQEKNPDKVQGEPETKNEQKPAEQKPVDQKPAEQKPAEQKPAKTQATEQKQSAEQNNPVQTMPQSAENPNPVRKSTEAAKSSALRFEDETSDFEEEPSKDVTFSFFDDSQVMSWPLTGDIVMDYSMDTAIFDKTLEQYRTNGSVCIEASVGSQVKSAAEGIVTKIYSTREDGNCVVIDHGNDWVTTYSQLQDNVLVTEGQIVKEGEVIGGVSEPTLYSVLLGPHLSFKITNKNIPADPKLFLASN